MKNEDTVEMSLNRRILSLSVPAIVSNVTVPLLGLCDTAVTGHLGDAVMLGAIAVGTMMMNVMVWLCGFLRMGTTGLTAQAFGSDDRDRQKGVLSGALAVALTIGLLAIVFKSFLESLLLSLIAPPDDVGRIASSYFSVCVLGLPAVLMNMVITGWLIGMQNTLWPMIIAVSSNALNIALSYLLAFPCGFGFIGVAFGTLTANWFAFVFSVIAIAVIGGKFYFKVCFRHIMKYVNKKFFAVNSDLFFRSACIMSVTMGVTAYGGRLGENILASNAVLMQFFTLFSFFMDGFAFTGEALCGRYAGQGNMVMLRRSVERLFIWSAGIVVIFTILYLFGFNLAVTLLTDIQSVIREALQMKIYVVLIPLLSFAAFLYDGFYIGLTKTRRMLVTTLIASGLFFCVINLISSNIGIWLGFLGYLLVRGIGLGLQFPVVLKSIENNSDSQS